jgi:hypothetical protein
MNLGLGLNRQMQAQADAIDPTRDLPDPSGCAAAAGSGPPVLRSTLPTGLQVVLAVQCPYRVAYPTLSSRGRHKAGATCFGGLGRRRVFFAGGAQVAYEAPRYSGEQQRSPVFAGDSACSFSRSP